MTADRTLGLALNASMVGTGQSGFDAMSSVEAVVGEERGEVEGVTG